MESAIVQLCSHQIWPFCDILLKRYLEKYARVPKTQKVYSLDLTHCIDGKLIENVKSFKYLGVILTCDLKWNDHINAVCAKARKLLGFLYRTVRGGDFRTLTYLFKSLVLPVPGSTKFQLFLSNSGTPMEREVF